MPIGPLRRLSLLTFPQSWNGTSLVARFLCLPKGDPRAALNLGLPAFAAANLVFQAQMIGSLDQLPMPSAATASAPLALTEIANQLALPTNKAALFDELAGQFTIVPRVAVARPQPQMRKVLTESYKALIGDRSHSPLLSEPDAFDCGLHQAGTDQPGVLPPPPSANVSWGKLMAFALRQPKLASALGLLGQVTVTPADPAFFKSGGWLYIDLDASSDYAASGIVARYAARIPAMTAARTVFAPILFPVVDVPTDFLADDIAFEAEKYDDGMAKLVHCAQSDGVGDSIRIAWEDEQIAEALQRQVNLTAAGNMVIDAPTGVAGYRVDVRQKGDAGWNSLLKIKSEGDLQVGALNIGPFEGEAAVEVTPAQISPKQDGVYWFPSYFAAWHGSSLALTDGDLKDLHGRPDVKSADAALTDGSHTLLDREKFFVPVDDKVVPLQYGKDYEFRVRMADLTRGGPDVSAALPDPVRNSVAAITFQRRRAPAQIVVLTAPKAGARQTKIARPRLGYPEALFTGRATFANLSADLDAISADSTITREISVPDPDVLSVEILVQVKMLDGESSPYLPLYTTTRLFVADEMMLDLAFEDIPALSALAVNQPTIGPLQLPAYRDIRLTFVPIGRDDAGYFATEQARRGAALNMDISALGTSEADLLADPEVFSSLRSFFFQPTPPDNSVASPSERLAAELGLDHLALTLSGKAGSRTALACSAALRHTLTPEGSGVTFGSAADLVKRWINVVRFVLQRDWTWNGLAADGITITRVIHTTGQPDATEVVGSFTLPRAISKKSLTGVPADLRDPIRQSTELIFFDAVDPKPRLPQRFPTEITVDYVLQPALNGLPPIAAVTRSILLPVTTPPSQTPKIFSAGIALSEFLAADDYSSTNSRQRMLWFEFAEAPADPDDAFFVRVLANGPDPTLYLSELHLPDSVETPLAIDPEWMRAIAPGQPRDESGLAAMQALDGSVAGPTRCLVPLPPGLQAASNELLGFFTYEIRMGHTATRWSTAQGRFGPMLRVGGVQHPAPPLVCQAARNTTGVLVKAPYATPVLNGANLRPQIPQTDLWAVLYARVRQADGLAWRNVLLTQQQLFAPRVGNDPERAGVPLLYGEGVFPTTDVDAALARLGLPADEPLTVLTAELFTDPAEQSPLADRLGHSRILRISPLVAVPNAC